MVYSYNRTIHTTFGGAGAAGETRGLEVRIVVSLRGRRRCLSGDMKEASGMLAVFYLLHVVCMWYLFSVTNTGPMFRTLSYMGVTLYNYKVKMFVFLFKINL